jgi:hypothetical protein
MKRCPGMILIAIATVEALIFLLVLMLAVR